MDDLEHSVVIAEQDWEIFYEESEECSVQPAWLASLDNSGISDTDDEENSTQESVSGLQAKPDKTNKEPDAAALTQSDAYDLEEPECLSSKMDNERSAEQTAEISLNDVSTVCACFTPDSSVSINDTSFTDQQHTASDINDFKEHYENCSEDKSGQAIGEPITSFPCIQDVGHVSSSEGERALKVSESSASTKKEKERWFVTVNDSPVMLRVKSGQKKRRKKKTSKMLVQQDKARERQSSVSDNKTEEGQILQNDSMQPLQTYSESIYFNPNPDCGEVILASCHNHELISSPVRESEREAFENSSIPNITCTSETSEMSTSCTFSPKCKKNSNISTDVFEINPFASVNSPSPSILADLDAQLQTDALIKDRTIKNELKSKTLITTPVPPATNNSGNKAHDDNQDDSSRLILETCLKSASLEKLQEQEPEMQEELKLPSQGTKNQGSQSLEATVSPNCPIYALSSFWDEMEKLTINDILHLRSAHNRSPMSRIAEWNDKDLLTSKHDSVQDIDLMDDSADSGYFTHVDESKPDRSSCELSTLSDSEEELLQILNRSASPKPQGQTENLSFTYIPHHDFDQNDESESLDIIKLSHQDGIQHYLDPAIEVQSLFLASSLDSNGNPFELEIIRRNPVLSFSDTTNNQSMLTFSESVIKEINGSGSSDRLGSTVASFPVAQNLSICEMYDDFFSDFEVGNFFFPSTKDRTVPIFSASHSVVRDLVLPKVEELHFDPDFEEDNMPIRGRTFFSSQPEMGTSPAGMANLCFSMSQRRNWSSLFSLRKARFIGKGSTWHHKVTSWIFSNEAEKTSHVSRPQKIAPRLQVGNKSLLQLTEPLTDAAFISSK